jgi:hypothetical protein
MKLTLEDPVIEEIRAVRRELSERFGGDVNALCDFLAQEEQQHAERLVNHPPRAPQCIHTGNAVRK